MDIASVIFSFTGYGLAVENNKSLLIPECSSRPGGDVKFLFHFGHKAWFFCLIPLDIQSNQLAYLSSTSVCNEEFQFNIRQANPYSFFDRQSACT